MNQTIAKKLLQELQKSAKALDAAEGIARKIEDESEQMDLRRAIGRIGASVYAELMYRVFQQYPDLEPDRDK